MERKITSISVIFLLYVVLWTCNNTTSILYGGYAILMFFTLVKLFLSDRGMMIDIYEPVKQLFFFMAYCCISLFWAINQEVGYQLIFFIVACVIWVIVMSNYFVRLKNVDIIILTIAVTGLVMSFYVIFTEGGISAFYAKAISGNIENEASLHASRVGDGVSNQNYVGLQCAFSTVVYLYYALTKRKRFCYLLMLISSVVAVASGSRTALIALAVGILTLLYYHQKKNVGIKKYFKVFLGLIIGAVLLNLILSLDIFYTVSTRMSIFIKGFSGADELDGSSEVRIEMIKIGLQQLWETPVFGIGLGNSRVLNAIKLNFPAYSHNDYIELLINGGIVGFVLYYRIFWYFVKEYLKLLKNDRDPALIISYAILIMLLVTNIFSVTYYNRIYTYMFFILWSSQIQIKKEEKLSESCKQDN